MREFAVAFVVGDRGPRVGEGSAALARMVGGSQLPISSPTRRAVPGRSTRRISSGSSLAARQPRMTIPTEGKLDADAKRAYDD
jgi:hypothetical protein